MTGSTPTPKSILIVRLSAIGDVIHALPVLDSLRREFPEARIGWVVEELSAPLLQHHPQLDKLYILPKKRWKTQKHRLYFSEIKPFFKAMKNDGWDVAIDLQGLTKSGVVAWASGAKTRIGFGGKQSRELNWMFMTKRVTPPDSCVHVVEKNLFLLNGLKPFETLNGVGKLGILESEQTALRQKMTEIGWDATTPLAALNPGAGWTNKRWPPAYFAELGKRFAEKHFLPLIFWGPGEEALRDEIAAELSRLSVPHLCTPKTTVREMAVLLSVCSFYVGGDTGPTHLAGMLGIPCVALFGASDGARNSPWPVESATVIQRLDFSCVPCWERTCPLQGEEYMQCLKQLSVQHVWEACEAKLNAVPITIQRQSKGES